MKTVFELMFYAAGMFGRLFTSLHTQPKLGPTLNSLSILVSTNGPPPPTSHLDKKSLDSLRDGTTPELKPGKPSDVICIED